MEMTAEGSESAMAMTADVGNEQSKHSDEHAGRATHSYDASAAAAGGVNDVVAETAVRGNYGDSSDHHDDDDAAHTQPTTTASTADNAPATHNGSTVNHTSTSVQHTNSDDNNTSLLTDLLQIKSLFGSSHLSDVHFVFASEQHTPRDTDTAASSNALTASTTDDNNNALEQHLLPAHRLVLALRSGTFRAALLRTKSSQMPATVRFPLKIHVQDTSYRVFAALVRFLYTNDTVDSDDDAFWRELLRAAYVYLVPALLEQCVAQIERALSCDTTSSNSNSKQTASAATEQLRNVLDVLVFTDTVLAAKHPVATATVAKRWTNKKPVDSNSIVVNADDGDYDNDGDGSNDDSDDLGFARCAAAVAQLQQDCMDRLTAASERDFEALVHSDAGRRCSTERFCAVLTQRSRAPLVVAIRYQLGRVVNELLKRGASLDALDDSADATHDSDASQSPLVVALATGNDAIVRRLLVDADAPYVLLTDKIPLFLLATASGNVAHCRILLEHSSSSVDSNNNANSSAAVAVNLVSPVVDGDKDIVAAFGCAQTPLHIASRRSHAAVVELLLQHGAVPNLQDSEGNTALHCAGSIATVETLLSSAFKTNPNIPNRRGQTPLHIAAANGSVGIVDLLIRSGCQQDIVDDQGQTAFHVAAANGHTSVALILLRENETIERTELHKRQSEKLSSLIDGASISAVPSRNGTSDSALHSATADGDNDNDEEVANDADAIAHFVVNQEDLKGNTALHLAAMSPSERCQKMVQLLLENGADPNHTNWFGYTPLHLFCSHQSGPESVIDVFIEHGVNIHVQSLDGSTALHLAVGRASESVAIALVVAGAQVHLQDAAGRSVVALAETTHQGKMLVPVLRNLAKAPEWVADDQASECASCRTGFRVAMRKHHCRHCGRIVCYNCSSNKIPIPKFALVKPARVCDTCFDVLSFRRLL